MGKGVGDIAGRALVFAALAAPPVYFFSIIYKYAANVPYWDDYSAILDFLIRYQDADGALQRLGLLFAQHNEHRIAFGNLATVVMYKLTGMADFRAMIFFGNAALLGLVLVFYRMFHADGRKPLYFIPVVFFLFQFQFGNTIFWAMASVSNFYVLLFTFAALLLLERGGRPFFTAAFLLAALASVTQGSGIFALAACALLLALKKELRGLSAWGALSAVVLALYFGFYEKPPGHPSVMQAIFEEPVNTIRYFFTLAGASFPLPFLAGLVFAILFIFLTLKGYYRKNPALYCGLVYVFLTFAVTALARSGFGIEGALSSRYKIVSVLLPILMYMAFFEHNKEKTPWKRIFFPAVMAGALVFNIHANVMETHKARNLYHLLTEGMKWWVTGAPSLKYPDQETANRILLESIERGIYKPDFR
ncbi:MAG: hypothetical protein H3C68_06415 [Deltaproteobacteria bacterium]|nr:hypothetical protein [Deltaproteobacteria bacterium]MBZ0219611.1 hypothetical protein [Deltaproteobacteria bacterium]